jgi:hypothetical protein
VLKGVKPAAAAAPAWADEISKIPILPSPPPHTVGAAKPVVPHAAERTWTLAATSCACRVDKDTPPPLHCSEPIDLNTLLVASSSSPPPQAVNDVRTAKARTTIRIVGFLGCHDYLRRQNCHRKYGLLATFIQLLDCH